MAAHSYRVAETYTMSVTVNVRVVVVDVIEQPQFYA
jgi:hypothetical protein